MDAREVIRHFLQGTDLSCDDLITALEWHGNRILHDSENHGPTIERAEAKTREMLVYADTSNMQDAAICAAIRAMEVKHGWAD